MAKRKSYKRKTVRTITTRRAAPKRSRRRKSSNALSGTVGMVVGGMAYGATRQYISSQLANITKGTSLGFLGEYSDEVTMGALSYFLMKGKIPFINKLKVSREIGKAGLYIESARAGSSLFSGMVQTKAPNGSGSTLKNA